MKPIVIIGGGGHGKVVADIVEKEGIYAILGFIDKKLPLGTEVIGYKIIASGEECHNLERFESEIYGYIVAIGDNVVRGKIIAELKTKYPRLNCVTTIHPSAEISKYVEIGEGSVIMAGAVINPGSKLGSGCIVNTRASIDHDNVLGDFSSIAPGATLGGNVSLGAYSAISIGATVIHGQEIGEHSVIGAGAVVLDNIPGYCLAYGVPAKVIRKRSKGEIYL